MGKAIAYLIVVVIGCVVLNATGLLDGIFSRGNLQERDAYWRKAVAAETPTGASRAAVEAFALRNRIPLECFSPSLSPPVTHCSGIDPVSEGGKFVHPMVLELKFVFHGGVLANFETSAQPAFPSEAADSSSGR